jgi:hypothetical protein
VSKADTSHTAPTISFHEAMVHTERHRTVREAEQHDGVPIALAQVEKLCKVLSDHHGRPMWSYDIKGLKLC